MAAKVNTPYPTAILVREKAMVINLESIRMIICKDQVRSFAVILFVQRTFAKMLNCTHHICGQLYGQVTIMLPA